MTLRRVIFSLLLIATLLAVLAGGKAYASNGRNVPGNRITVDHGDIPNGVGGIDGIRTHPGNGGASMPDGVSLRSRAKARMSGGPSTRPQP